MVRRTHSADNVSRIQGNTAVVVILYVQSFVKSWQSTVALICVMAQSSKCIINVVRHYLTIL